MQALGQGDVAPGRRDNNLGEKKTQIWGERMQSVKICKSEWGEIDEDLENKDESVRRHNHLSVRGVMTSLGVFPRYS